MVTRFHRTLHQTLFLLIDSEAPSKDWMQADKASCDSPWNTALWWEKRETSPWAIHKQKGPHPGPPLTAGPHPLTSLYSWQYSSWSFLFPCNPSRLTHRFVICISRNIRDPSQYILRSYFSPGSVLDAGGTGVGGQGWHGSDLLALSLQCDLQYGAGCFRNI